MQASHPTPHVFAQHDARQVSLAVLLVALWTFCVGCEESTSTHAQALTKDIELRFQALEPPTLRAGMMPLEPLLDGLRLGTTKLSEFKRTPLGQSREFSVEPTEKPSISDHLEQPGAFTDALKYEASPKWSWGDEWREARGGPVVQFILVFSKPRPGEEQVLTAFKLFYKKQPFCEELERSFALSPSLGMCSDRLIPGSKWANSRDDEDAERYSRWVFCAATPSREYVVRVECEDLYHGQDTLITYDLVKPLAKLPVADEDDGALRAHPSAAQ